MAVIILFLFIFISTSFANPARVIKDLEVIYGYYGVPVSYSYNETHTPGKLASVPGCPKSISGVPWVYYGNPPKCFLAETYGPCPYGERLFIQPNSQYGLCACACLEDYDNYQEELAPNGERFFKCFNAKRLDIWDFGETGQVFDKKEKKCYTMYERGPCRLRHTVVAGFNSTALECLPKCDVTREGWREMLQKRICAFPGSKRQLSPVPNIGKNKCWDPSHRFSTILRKCVAPNKGRMLVVG